MPRLCHDTSTPNLTIYRHITTLVKFFDTIVSCHVHDPFMITLRLLYDKIHISRCRKCVRQSFNMLMKSWTLCVTRHTRLHAVGKLSSMCSWHRRHRNIRYIFELFTTFSNATKIKHFPHTKDVIHKDAAWKERVLLMIPNCRNGKK